MVRRFRLMAKRSTRFNRGERKRKPRKKNMKAISSGKKALFNPRSDIGLIPKKFISHLRYCETVSLTSVSGAIGEQAWRPDGLFKPNVDSTGHRPLYFDQAMLLWFAWNVISAKVTSNYSFDTSVVQPTGSVIVGQDLDENDVLNWTSRDSMIEENRIKWRVLDANNKNYARLVTHYNCNRFHGTKDREDNSDLWGSDTANPTKDVFVHNVLFNQDSISATVICTVVIDFTVEFRAPRDVSPSSG